MKRSWIDALIHWATTRRVPWWVIVGMFWAFEILAVNAVKWIDGSLAFPALFVRTVDTFYGVFGLIAYGYVGRLAGRALTRFRPALSMSDDEVAAIRVRLTSMPARMAIVAAAAGGIVGVVALLSDPMLMDEVSTSLPAAVVIGLFNNAFAGVVAVFFAQIVRVLRLVSVLHARAENIDLFRPDPAHAFARVTAAAGGSMIVLVSYSVATDPNTFENPVWIGVSIFSSVLALVAFVLPLLGMRRRLRERKEALLDASVERIGRVATAIDQAVDDGRFADVPQLKTSRDALGVERDRIAKASTWPWEAATLRGFVTTLLLPIAIWLLTSVLGKALGL